MISFFKTLTKNKEKIWSFSGGIYPPKMKIQLNKIPLQTIPLANELIIPIKEDIGSNSNLLIKSGDYVLKGQPLTKGNKDNIPIHATTSGIITSIVPHITAHSSKLKILCVRLEADNKDQWCERKPLVNYLQYSTKVLLSNIEQAGIVGLGGAGFPTAKKLKNSNKLIKTLIINAAESEPYISADDGLIQEHADEIIEGILILIHILKPKEALIGIEDNKIAAIAALKDALLRRDTIIKIKVIPSKYPSGGAKQLTKILTGKEIPHGDHSSSIGVLMQNVATVFAIKRAIINGEPLIERVVTLTGGAIKKPGNYWVRFGIPINFLLEQVGIFSQSKQMVIIGGPLMGFILSDLSAPIVKINNCIFVPSVSELSRPLIEESCIRCGFCVEVCPVNLLPQQLYWFSRGQEHEKANKHHLFDCIECGACAYVCPSNIPLLQYYRKEKIIIKAIIKEKERAFNAKRRFEAKKLRFEQKKILHQECHDQGIFKINVKKKAAMNSEIMKINMKKKQNKNNNLELLDNFVPSYDSNRLQSTLIHGAKGQKDLDPRKAIIAAAIARVKAKRNKQKSC